MNQSCERWGEGDVHIIAQSLGGAVAIPAIALLENHCIKSLVVDSSFLSYRQVARKKFSQFFLTWPFQYPLSFLVSDHFSPMYFLKKIKLPLLYFHSEKDQVVPFSQGKALFDFYPYSKKKIMVVKETGHCQAFAMKKNDYKVETLNFLKSL